MPASKETAWLIKQAELYGSGTVADIRIRDGLISEISPSLTPNLKETVVQAESAALLPGLHDHHIHLLSFAASLNSLPCGPPNIHSEEELAQALVRENSQNNQDHWLRGIGYHNSIAGDIDRHWLDRWIPDRPIRIQHRGGRLWVLNSCALNTLGIDAFKNAPAGLEYRDGYPSGRLFEGDAWLRTTMQHQIPSLLNVSQRLASYGVTGVTDTTPDNENSQWQIFDRAQNRKELLQTVRVMGQLDWSAATNTNNLQQGEYKIHLLESQLPNFDSLCQSMAEAHKRGRSIAVHCVTLTELLYTLSALEEVGVCAGDRIEHASITPPDQMKQIADMGLRVVTQPHFIAERGEQYLADVTADEQAWLYRGRGFHQAGIPFAGGSDAPFGDANPWRSMQAAVKRRTPSGILITEDESLTPEQALALYISEPHAPGMQSK